MTTPTALLFSPAYSRYPAVQLANAKHEEGSVWGLGRREVEPQATFVFEGWKDTVINDIYALYSGTPWNPGGPGNPPPPLASSVVTQASDRYNLNVPREKLPDGEYLLYSQVTRAASGQLVRSTPERFLIKTDRPGGLTYWASEQFHRGLFLSVEKFAENAYLTLTNIVGGIWVRITKYENCRQNDIVILAYGASTIEHTVSPEEADGSVPIRILISEEVILKGSKFGAVGIAFMVRDVVNNTSGDKFPYSKPFILNSRLNTDMLQAPLLLLKGAKTSVVDLDLYAKEKFEARTFLPLDDHPTAPPPYRVVLVMLITQKFEGGESTRTVRLPPVVDTGIGGDNIPIPNETFNNLTNAKISMSYEWQTSTGKTLRSSGITVIDVIGTAPLTLTAPAFDNKPGPQTITAQNYVNGAAVAVAYQRMSNADVIRLIWTNANGTVTYIAPQTGTSGGIVFFPISAQIITQSAGQLIKLSYEVTVGGKTAASDVQELTFIQPFKIAQDTMMLTGLSIKANWPKTTGLESVGNSGSRTPTGGVGKLTYSSTKPSVASVNAQGLVVGNGWGNATIEVRDQAGNMVSYPVYVSNVYNLLINDAPMNFNVALGWINSGHRQVGWDGVADLQRVYGPKLSGNNRHYWFGPTSDPATALFYHWLNAGIASGGRNDFAFGAWTLSQRVG